MPELVDGIPEKARRGAQRRWIESLLDGHAWFVTYDEISEYTTQSAADLRSHVYKVARESGKKVTIQSADDGWYVQVTR